MNDKHGRTYDDDIEELSNEQKKLRLINSSIDCGYQIQDLKHQRNFFFKEIRKRLNANREKEIEEAVKGMKRLQEESRLFKAAKMLNCKRFENPFVHEKKMENMYRILKKFTK